MNDMPFMNFLKMQSWSASTLLEFENFEKGSNLGLLDFFMDEL